MLWGGAWMELACGMGQVDEVDGTVAAVLCLEPPRLRDNPRVVKGLAAAGGVALGAALEAVWSPLVGGYAAVLIGLCGWAAWSKWRDREVRRRLDTATPAGG